MSYYNEATGRFALGWDDIFFVFYWIIVFTGMRCAVMDYVLTPAAAWAGIEKKKARVRFAEQAWILLYYGAFWSCGMVGPPAIPTPLSWLTLDLVYYVQLQLLALTPRPVALVAHARDVGPS